MENTVISFENLRRFLENFNSTLKQQQSYIDEQNSITLANAKSYSDKVANETKVIAANDATNKANKVQSNLDTHTKNNTDAHNLVNRFNDLKSNMKNYTDQSISNLIGGAPSMLDTLYEFSNAIGNDPNFSASIMDLIGKKLNSSDVVTTPTKNKVLRLNNNAQYPPSVIAQDSNNRFFTDNERNKLADLDTFLNNDPKCGFDESDNKALIFGTFDINLNLAQGSFIISDNTAKENLYYFANSGDFSKPFTLHKATRMLRTQDWTYRNEEIRPYYLKDSEYISNLLAVGTDYMIQTIRDTEANTYRTFLIKTYGSSKTDEWVKYLDITGCYDSGSINNGSIYFSEYNTLAIIHIANGVCMYLKLYDLSNNKITAINSKYVLIEDINSIMDYSMCDNSSSIKAIFRGDHRFTAIFNEEDNQLIVYSMLNWQNLYINNNLQAYYQILFLPFKISNKKFFKDCSGTVTFAMKPKTDYKFPNGVANTSRNTAFYQNVSYDKYSKRINTVYQYMGSLGTNAYIESVESKNRPQTLYYSLYNTINSRLYTPDACPWSKYIYGPGYFNNGTICFHGDSKKYGNVCITTEYDLTKLNNGAIRFIPKTWYINSKEGGFTTNKHMAIIRSTESKVRFIYYDRINLYEITHKDFTGTDGLPKKGKAIANNLSNPIPTLPTKYNYLAQCYDYIRNRAFFIVNDKKPSDSTKRGFGFLLYWDSKVGFKEYRNIPELDSYSEASRNYFKTYAELIVPSNFFIDTDGLVYVIINWRSSNGQNGGNTFVIDMSKTVPMYTLSFNFSRLRSLYNSSNIGYDNTRGYYYISGIHGSLYKMDQLVCFSKSFNSSDPEKTKDEFFSGNFYQANLLRESTVGLVAYLQPTNIFLGGYYSVTDAEEIPLTANSENYIYLERDANDNKKVNVIVSNRLIGGEKGFNRVLASKITTNSEKIIAQEDYPIVPNIAPLTHVGSYGVDQHKLADGKNAGFSSDNFTSTEKNKLSLIQEKANNYTHPSTHPMTILDGVLPITKGGTGTSTKQGIVQLLYNSGNKNSKAISDLYTFAFESSGNNCGYLTLANLKTKLGWTTEELQEALKALPNI